ncbi:MAG: hypothetical protein A3I29_00365 [Candidatus Magasanikbacteria bacterium RIFCSPLOWO2_02_FULL_44_11]|uniref:Uncharacterized protein n=2 Tax=Candidatus Magasanikiibacteriota TaxID=1752731 RepID=A0A1F6NAJ1_9BACT|nr:MAG: hypothetical protein A3D53_01275 [Candidatus Magasanikbacteria bacterium RIFCSPHIGHO2_02_FULL_45_10]OGH80889.1 MAG: hypothetical protein A3I29_00365 [Candidatus Magasanikbacteria bacterium RIFCSPLOWO2_02_FULL_44_11]
MHLESSVGSSHLDVHRGQPDISQKKRDSELKLKLDVQFRVMEKMDFLKEKPDGMTDEDFNQELMAAFDHWDKVGNGSRFRLCYQELREQGISQIDVLTDTIFKIIQDDIARENNAAVMKIQH